MFYNHKVNTEDLRERNSVVLCKFSVISEVFIELLILRYNYIKKFNIYLKQSQDFQFCIS
jgi:hypothetical protein